MDPRGLRVTKNADFSLLTLNKELLLVTFCDTTSGIGANFQIHKWMHGRMEKRRNGQTDVEVEIVMHTFLLKRMSKNSKSFISQRLSVK